MTLEISMIAWAAFMITWSFVWSRNERRKIAKAKFKRELQGYKFGSLKELQAHWHGTIDISFGIGNKEFDPNYHGNLLETLRIIDEAVRQELKRWNS
jgi:hypothetical protein